MQERILIVDDEDAVRRLIGTMLTQRGYSVMEAGSVREALDRLQEGPAYAMVLCDIMMSGSNGLHLLEHLCTDYPGTPVVMLSAIQDAHVVVQAFRGGATDYLFKPFARAQLDEIVARALKHGQRLKTDAEYRSNLEEIVSTRTGRLRATMEDLERSYDTTLEAMGDALDLRDEETEGHSRRVTAYTIALARAMGLKGEELKVIARGAFLHDLGKIATPDSILLKPGKLDPEEMRIMREHCRRGYEIVSKIPFLKDAAEIVYAHQERFDGMGYPRSLRGEQIPLGARIFAIADTLDAMTSDRPYRKGTSFAAARDEIASCSGAQFDPGVVDVFLRMPIDSWNKLRQEIMAIAKSSPLGVSTVLCRPAVTVLAHNAAGV